MNPAFDSRRTASPVAWAMLLPALAALAMYWPGLTGPFLFDDFPVIVTNAALQQFAWSREALEAVAWSYDRSLPRPLAMLWFGLDMHVGNKDPWQFNLSGLIVHAMNAMLATALIYHLLQRASRLPRERLILMAGIVGGAWALHPLQVSSVLYIVQRMETLAATFMLLALLCYWTGRMRQIEGRQGWGWILAAAPATAVGLLAKETAILTPLFALVLEFTLLRFEAARKGDGRLLRWAFGAGAILAGLAFAVLAVPPHLAPEAYAIRDFTLEQRLLSQSRALGLYLVQILLPLPALMPFHYDQFQASTGWTTPPTTIIAFLALTLLAALAIALRRARPLFALGVFWFLSAHFLSSNVFALELVFEHRNYLALLGVLLAIVGLLLPWIETRGRAALAVSLVAVAALGMTTWQRTTIWGQPLELARHLAEINPASPRAASDLATLYIARTEGDPGSPFYRLGIAEFERAARLPRASPLPEQGLILTSALHGQPADPAWWQSLTAKLEQNHLGVQERLAITGLMQQRFRGLPIDDASLTVAYGTYLSREPADPDLYRIFADYALRFLQDADLARRVYAEAVAVSGHSPEFVARVSQNLSDSGYTEMAEYVRSHAKPGPGAKQ